MPPGCEQPADRGAGGTAADHDRVKARRRLRWVRSQLNGRSGSALFLFLVAPRRGLRPGNDSGDIGIDTISGCGFIAPAGPVETSRGFHLLFFLASAFTRAFVLSGSRFLHSASQ